MNMPGAVTVFFLLTVSLTNGNVRAETSGFVELQVRVQSGEAVPLFVGGISHFPGKSRAGLFVFGLITEGWAQGYAGAVIRPVSGVELSVGSGIEADGGRLYSRYGIALSVLRGPYSFTGILEGNDRLFQGDVSGVWYDFFLTRVFTPSVSLGLRARRSIGMGLHATVAVPSLPLRLSVAWLPLDPESKTLFDPDRAMLTATFDL